MVRSLNSNLYKLAVVDESLAQRFFREARISDPMVQRDLIALMKSKPTAFRGEEARQIMDDISPVLSDLARVYDESPMCSISLTLLGLYLGRAHVKAPLGKNLIYLIGSNSIHIYNKPPKAMPRRFCVAYTLYLIVKSKFYNLLRV